MATSKKINTFKVTTLQRLDETLEKQEFLSSVGRIKSEILMLLHQINEKFENHGLKEIGKESTTFELEVLNSIRTRNGKKINGGKRFSFPYKIANELNLRDRSLLTVKVIAVKDVSK